MRITGVLFDFSGTLFRIEPAADWLRTVLDRAGIRVPGDRLVHWARRLEETGALPGGSPPRNLPAELREAWEARDLDPHRHRDAYVALTRAAGLPWPELAVPLYERHMEPAAWTPYPDAAEALKALRRRGVRVAVVSNIGWDLRPVFRAHGLADFVEAYVLSYEHGVVKPHPALFRAACEALGASPRDVLMVGDNAEADGGAADLGCVFRRVDHLPVASRPAGLLTALEAVG